MSHLEQTIMEEIIGGNNPFVANKKQKKKTTKKTKSATVNDEDIEKFILDALEERCSLTPSSSKSSRIGKKGLTRSTTSTSLSRDGSKKDRLARSTTSTTLNRDKTKKHLARSVTADASVSEDRKKSLRQAWLEQKQQQPSNRSRLSSKSTTESDPQMVLRLLEQYSSMDSKLADAYFKSVKRSTSAIQPPPPSSSSNRKSAAPKAA